MPGDYDIEYASPWAGANFMPVGKEGSRLRAFERASWPEIDRLCREVPEAGIHYQDCKLYGREKDEGTAVGTWFQELMKEDPWFKDLMPEVGPCHFPLYYNHDTPHDFEELGEEEGFCFASRQVSVRMSMTWLLHHQSQHEHECTSTDFELTASQ